MLNREQSCCAPITLLCELVGELRVLPCIQVFGQCAAAIVCCVGAGLPHCLLAWALPMVNARMAHFVCQDGVASEALKAYCAVHQMVACLEDGVEVKERVAQLRLLKVPQAIAKVGQECAPVVTHHQGRVNLSRALLNPEQDLNLFNPGCQLRTAWQAAP